MHNLFRSIRTAVYPRSEKDKPAPLAPKTPTTAATAAQRNFSSVTPVTPIQRLSDDPRRLQELRKTFLN